MRIVGGALIVFVAIGAASPYALFASPFALRASGDRFLTAHQVGVSPQQPTTSPQQPTTAPAQGAPQQPATPPTPTTPPGAPQTGVPAPTTPATPTAQGAAPVASLPVDRVFASDAGMIFNPIRPDKVLDFEMILGRIHEALAQSTEPARRAQAAGWKVFKAAEPGPNGSTLYVFLMDPVVPKADYTVSKVLADAFPMEVRELYKIYIGAFAGSPSLVNLKLQVNFATRFTPPATKPLVTPKPGDTKPGVISPPVPRN